MMMMRRAMVLWIAVMAALVVFAQHASAVTVRFDVQPRSTYVGVPVSLRITIADADYVPAPELPDLTDFTVLGPPAESESSMTRIINGRVTSSSEITYTYRLAPKRSGRLTIPTIRFDVAGETFQTDPVTINVEEPTNDGLLQAEVIAPVESVYVGEGVELTLRITVKQYVDDRYHVRLQDRDMWQLMRTEATQWGVFEPAIRALDERRRVPASKVVRPSGGLSDDDVFYQFEVTQVVHPDRAGPLDLGNIVVYMEYPLSLDRSLLGGYSLERTRPVVAAVEAPDIEVKPLPSAGRPANFSGAVGSFTMNVGVKPIDVAVGEPITLSLTLTDRSTPAARLDLLHAPPLHNIDALTNDFRVHEEQLAGALEGRNKTFTQTIRARNEDVATVPPIPFTFFDPQREEYVTIKSDPIPLTVRPASTLAMSDIVQSEPGQPEVATLTPAGEGILANIGDPNELLRSESFEPSWWWLLVLVLPPAMFAVMAVSHRRAERLRRDPVMVRQRHAFKRADEALSRAARQQSGAEAEVAAAVAGYVADRCNLPPGAHTRAEVAACLERRRVQPELVSEVTGLMQRCEHAAYTGAMNGSPRELADEGKAIIARLERGKWS